MRLKNTPAPHSQIAPTQYSTAPTPTASKTVATVTTPPVTASILTSVQTRPNRRRWLRLGLLACFLTPLGLLGSQVPHLLELQKQQAFLQSPEARESILVPAGMQAVTSSFSPDGKTLALVVSAKYPKNYSGPSLPAYVSFWDWKTRTDRGVRVPLTNWTTPLVWRNGGKELLLPGAPNQLVEVETGKVTALSSTVSEANNGQHMIQRRFQGYKGQSLSPTFLVADVSTGKTLAPLELPRPLATLSSPTSSRNWHFSPDLRHIALAKESNLVYWEIGKKLPLWFVRTESSAPVTFDPTGRLLYTTVQDQTKTKDAMGGTSTYTGPHLTCLDTATGQRLWTANATETLGGWAEEILLAKERILMSSWAGISVYNTKTKSWEAPLRWTQFGSHSFSGVPRITLSPDGTTVAERYEFGIRLRPLEGTN